MLAAVSRTEGVEPPFVRFLAEGTVEAVAGDVEACRAGAGAAGGLVALQPHGERPPIFFVPGHDGALAGIAAVARALGAAQPLWAFTLGDDPAEATLEATAARCVGLLRAARPHGPYRLAGVCFGGLVAYEMARQLRGAGEAVELVALIDALNPAWARRQPARVVAGAWARHWRAKARHHAEQLAAVGAAGAPRYLRDRLTGWARHCGEWLEARALGLGLRVRGRAARPRLAYRRQMLRYAPGEYAGPVLLVVVRGRRLDAPLLGWGQTARGPIEAVEVPRGPRGALAGEGARRVAALLAERLG
jgi:thioesterase domain-containing protein